MSVSQTDRLYTAYLVQIREQGRWESAGSRFELQSHADALFAQPRQLAFSATTLDEYALWKAALHRKLIEALGLAGRVPPRTVHAEPVQQVDRGAYTEEKFALDAGESVQIPAYILRPKSAPPYKPVLVFHGHNPSVQYVLGNYPDAQTAQAMRAVDNNYAQVLAEAGYLVCAIEQRGFGERVTPQICGDGLYASACRHLSFAYLAQGRTMLGERLWDGMVAATFVLSRNDIVPGALGCTGNSAGGTTALWLAALDEHITVAVPSSYFCAFELSIHAMYHCECNYVPGVRELIEMGDLAALIAPRPFRAIHGEHDPIYPVVGTRAQFETVRRAYALHGAEERCSLAVHPGQHAYNHAFSHEWFGRWL